MHKFVAAVAILALCNIAHAADTSVAEIQAALRTLGFVDTLRGHPSIAIGVVYRQGDLGSKAYATRIAAVISKQPRIGSSNLLAEIVATNELTDSPRHLDVLYVVPGMKDHARTVADYIKRQHVISLSNDPTCLEAQYCVLMIQAGNGVEIVLDTALAQSAQTQFSSVFTMMVKRK